MPRCCPLCPRESTASGMTRHRKTCTTYQQFMEAGLRLAQEATRTTLQARQQAVEVEEAGTGWIEPDVAVSFGLLIFTQMVLTSRSPLALVKQMLGHLTQSHSHPHPHPPFPSLCRNTLARLKQSHCHPHHLFPSPSLRRNPLCPNLAVLNARTNYLLGIETCYPNHQCLLLRHPQTPPLPFDAFL